MQGNVSFICFFLSVLGSALMFWWSEGILKEKKDGTWQLLGIGDYKIKDASKKSSSKVYDLQQDYGLQQDYVLNREDTDGSLIINRSLFLTILS